MASAEHSLDGWRVRTVGGGKFNLEARRDERRTDMTLSDPDHNIVATMVQVGATMASSIIVCNAEERPCMIVRADGLGGMNAIAANGNVLLYAGRSRSCSKTLDVLLTDLGCHRPLVVLFSLIVALEAEKVGPLYSS